MVDVSTVEVRSILTRTSGFLRTVTSHSLQPYRGCTFGGSLCGVGCYVRHNGFVTRGRSWGSFLEVRANAAAAYRRQVAGERRWAEKRGHFSIFLSSSTDPFLPQERRYGITASLLEAMVDEPPDELILQTHSHTVSDHLPAIRRVTEVCDLRVHLSIECDRDRLPGLPPAASTVERRFAAAAALRDAGVCLVVTVAPLLPIADADAFFARIAEVADAVVIDHYVGGDGSPDGARTTRTRLPEAMRAVDPTSTQLSYRERMADVAQRHLPGRVGLHIDGFAGRFLPTPDPTPEPERS